MSKCSITIFDNPEDTISVTFEGATVSEALAMKAEYLMQTVGAQGAAITGSDGTPGETSTPAPTSTKPSGFLSRTKGGE